MCRAGTIGLSALLLIEVVLWNSGCGKQGAPRPPLPRGPLPPTDVSARQTGASAVISFRVPAPRGDKPSMQPARVELVRVEYRPGNVAPPDPNAFRRRGQVVATLQGDPLPGGERVKILDETLTLGDGSLPPGTTLRYGIRVRDRRGRSSPLVVALDLVPVIPPSPPASITAIATAEGIRLNWEGAVSDDPGRYNLYRALAGGRYTGKPLHPSPLSVSEFLDTTVQMGQTYTYMVRSAVSDSEPYLESVSSPEVRVLAEDLFPPSRPGGLVAVQEGAGIRLFWNPGEERDLSGYRIYRRLNDGEWMTLEPDPVTQPLFLDRSVRTGDRIFYRVSAVDRADPPNESAPSEEVSLVVATDPEAVQPEPSPDDRSREGRK